MATASHKGQTLGYIRVSSLDQNPERQLDGQALDKTFTDQASGKDTDRPQLQVLIEYAREGDLIMIHSMDRLARNVDDLRRLVTTLTKKGIKVQFLKESLTFTGEDSPMAHLLLSMMGAIAEFERSLIRERQREGIALAKKKGLYRGAKHKLNAEQIDQLRQRASVIETKAQIAKDLKISRNTLYRYPSHGDT